MENTDLLKRILNHLIINYPFMPNIGLLDGKMGGVVFFATYAKRMNATHLNRLADLLFEDVYENITEIHP